MLDDLLDALERDPGFRTFLLDGQTVLLEDYLRLRPEQEARVRALVGAGRIGAGPWYVLADELIPSGESLLRNLLLGNAACRRLGRRLDVMYSPDAFGHPAVWPALAAEFGIRHGVLWRGLAPAEGDGDLFRWAGPDGSELLLYHLPREGYEIGASLPDDPHRLREAWEGIRETLVSRASTSHVAVFIGADHHAARRSPSVLRERLAALEPAHEVRISGIDEFLAAAGGAEVRRIHGELRDSYGYTWTLQGVHGTRLPLKRLNSRVEVFLERWAEPLSALAQRRGGRDRRPLLAEAWRATVQSHFHDAIAGCVHDRVAEEVEGRLSGAADMAREVARDSIDELVGHDPDAARTAGRDSSLVVWNPAASPRGGVVVADLTFFRRDVLVGPPGARIPRSGKGFPSIALALADGSLIPVQVIEQRRALERRDARRNYPDLDEVDAVRVAFEVPPIAGLSGVLLTPARRTGRAGPEGSVGVARGKLSNDAIEVEVGGDATLAIRDCRSGSVFRGLLIIESESDTGDTYSFSPGPGRTVSPGPARVATRIVASGPLLGIVEARWEALDASFRLRVELRSGEPFVRCSLELDNRGTDRRLRARFPTGMSSPIMAGAAFAVERRSARAPERISPAESPVATAPAHRFIAAGDGRSGLALLVPGHCEYEWREDGDLLLTLLRSVGQLSRADLATRPGHAGWFTPTPGAQCIGRDRIQLAIAPLSGRSRGAASLHSLWERAFLPPAARWYRDSLRLQPPPGSIELEGEGLVPSAAKPAEDGRGIILRCWNSADAEVRGRWLVVPRPERASRIRADEDEGRTVIIERDGSIRFTAAPGAIVTLRID